MKRRRGQGESSASSCCMLCQPYMHGGHRELSGQRNRVNSKGWIKESLNGIPGLQQQRQACLSDTYRSHDQAAMGVATATAYSAVGRGVKAAFATGQSAFTDDAATGQNQEARVQKLQSQINAAASIAQG